MKIQYTNSQGVSVTGMTENPLTTYAVQAYGSALNTDARRGKWHSPREFAEAIREVWDCKEPRTAAVVEHLESLK